MVRTVENRPNELPARPAFDADPPCLPDKDGFYAIPIPGIYKPYPAVGDSRRPRINRLTSDRG
jgi:hypothetical protein